MLTYIIRRILYAIPTIICVMLLTFLVFFVANNPDDIAFKSKGGKNVTPEEIEKWKREKGYDLPLIFNTGTQDLKVGHVTDWKQLAINLSPETKDSKLTPAQKHIHTFLSSDTKTLLQSAVKDKIFKEKQKKALLKDLNSFLNKENIYDSSAFATTLLAEEAKTLASNAPELSSSEKVRLNRLLLEAAFPDELSPASRISGFGHFTQTLFYQKNVGLLWFEFGRSDVMELDIGRTIGERMWPSLCITLPATVLGVFVYLTLSMLVAYFRGTYFDGLALFLCVFGMSVSILFYIIGGQVISGTWLKLTPISGFTPGLIGWKFLLLPIMVAIINGVGASTRFYRTVFLEELNRDYIRTARSKGVGEQKVLFRHALRNSLIPIITNLVAGLPLLFMGSLLLEAFFSIPGLGSFLVEAIGWSDLSVIRSMVYLGSVLYIIGLILTDICYAWADPRVRLG